MPTVATVGALVLALALVVGCGSDDRGGARATDDEGPMPSESDAVEVAMADLDGATYVSTDVTGHALVPGSRVSLTVEGDVLSVSGGCNTLFSAAEVTEGVLRWTGEAASTMMACPDDLMAQDQWLSAMFTDGMAATREGEELVMSADDVTIRLDEQRPDADEVG